MTSSSSTSKSYTMTVPFGSMVTGSVVASSVGGIQRVPENASAKRSLSSSSAGAGGPVGAYAPAMIQRCDDGDR